jgi:hypothetical protein
MSSRPEKMYHYQPLGSPEMMGWIERALLRHEIYFSSPASFNDPFDCKVLLTAEGTRDQKIDFIIENSGVTKEEATKALAANPKLFENALAQIQANFGASLGVYCLSERYDDILMWSHYARAHRGICLVFAGEIFPEGVVRRVAYPSNNEYPKADIFTSSNDERRDAILLTKAKHWEYEREWRVIDSGGPGFHAINPNWLVEIIFGCETPGPQVAEIKRIARMRSPSPILSLSKKKHREFALSIEPF